MSEYALIRPFDIDHGELAGLRKQDCFVLGYELCMMDRALASKRPIDMTIHSENLDRVLSWAGVIGRKVKATWCHEDPSESYVRIRSEPVSRRRSR